jgi:hypothetical protein
MVRTVDGMRARIVTDARLARAPVGWGIAASDTMRNRNL